MAGFAVLARRTENSPLDCFVDGRPIDFPSHKSCITHPRSKKNLNQTHTAFNLSLFLAGVAGFEPTNAGIKIPCLTAWRHPNAKKYGAGDKFRTCYLQSHNLALYRLSYARRLLVRLERFEPPTHGLEGRCSILLSYRRVLYCAVRAYLKSVGAGDGNRTHATSLEG